MLLTKVRTRTKTGCLTCKIRRVKCDETRPSCRRCLTTGRKCDGYTTLLFSRRELQNASRASDRPTVRCDRGATGLLSAFWSDFTFENVTEKRYFQFFRERTIVQTINMTDGQFWDRVLLQACHKEPAIKHAVLALSSLHMSNSDPELRRRHIDYTERQYAKAISAAQLQVASASPNDLDSVLITCLLFVCYEAIQGNYAASTTHRLSGRRLLSQSKESSHAQVSNEIVQTLWRMEAPALTFQDISSPYVHQEIRTLFPMAVPYFRTLPEAHASFVDLTWPYFEAAMVDDVSAKDKRRWQERCNIEHPRCAVYMSVWRQGFDDLVARLDTPLTMCVTHLQIWHATMEALMIAGPYGLETRWDDAMCQYQEVVSLAEGLIPRLVDANGNGGFSLEGGYVAAVFHTATRCRDPILRRRAIAILRIPRQEGLWHSSGAAAVAQRWLEIEEEGLVNVMSAADFPELSRVLRVRTLVDVARSRASLMFEVYDVDGLVTTRSESVQWSK